MKKTRKLYRNILILIIAIYVIFTLINQQKTLNQYADNSNQLAKQIEEQKQYNEELNQRKNDVDSLEFIEETAREKLDMYYPNERVYIDTGM